MSILSLQPNSPRSSDPAGKPDSNAAAPPPDPGEQPEHAPRPKSQHLHPIRKDHRIRISTGRFGELDEHELIHLIDSLDDERSRARFRESIYISVIIWICIGWFLFYGPRILFHQPVLRDPIALLKQHDKEELTYLNPPTVPKIKPPAPVVNQKLMQQLQKQAKEAPPTPQPPTQQAPPPPQEEAHNTAPPVPQPAIPLPAAPKPQPSVELPSAPPPRTAIAQNSQSAHSAMQDALRGALSGGRTGAEVGAPGSGGPLQAGTQILSDIGDWDPSNYMRKLHHDIQNNWDPLIPQEVQPPLMKKGIVGIRFIILRDGQIGDIKLETTSGDVALDRAAWYAITSEGQFPKLPPEYKGPQLELRVGFFYNTPISQ